MDGVRSEGQGAPSWSPKPLLTALALLGAVAAWSGCKSNKPGADGLPRAASDIVGIDSAGGTFRLSEQRGKVIVLSFGYTSCPDVCPTTLAKAKGMVRALGDRAKEVAFAFVSVDPERDTPERLAGYIGGFDPGFHGIFVERPRLDPLLVAYDVIATKRVLDASRTDADASKYYSIDHTGGYQLIDKTGQLRIKVPPAANVDALVANLDRLLGEEGTVTVTTPHARISPGSDVGAAYFRIQNAGDHADRLLSVASPDAARAELHEVVDDQGIMRMVPRPDGIAVDAHGSVDLAEGGKHVMLMGLSTRDAAAPLTLHLHFERAGVVEIKVPVQPMETAAQP